MSVVFRKPLEDGKGKRDGRAREMAGWKAALQELIDANAGARVNGNVASFRTRELAATTLFNAFNTLHAIGHRIQKPKNFDNSHVEALVTYWYEKGHGVGTMQSALSVLRKFCVWIGKKGMIQPLPHYLKNVPATLLKRTATIKATKSWSGNGVDIEEKIAEADRLDTRFGLMLRAAIAFGLRRKELVMLRPWKADFGDHLAVFSNAGPKTGKARTIAIKTEYQRLLLDQLKERIPKSGALGWTHTRRGKPASLAYQLAEYKRRMRELGITKELVGVTGHGLRAEFSEDAGKREGYTPPTMGGTADQMPKEDLDLARARVSEMLGHSRLSVMNSYYGSFGNFNRKPEKRAEDPNRAPGKATPTPVSARKVSQYGSPGEAANGLLKGFRRRKPAQVDARQMDLQLHDGVLMFKKRPK